MPQHISVERIDVFVLVIQLSPINVYNIRSHLMATNAVYTYANINVNVNVSVHMNYEYVFVVHNYF